jgi:hypothetical protein
MCYLAGLGLIAPPPAPSEVNTVSTALRIRSSAEGIKCA